MIPIIKKTLILLFSLSLFSLPVSALSQEFYLKKVVAPEKLLPNTLSCTVNVGESQTFYVDILPKGSETDVLWTISPAIATITQKNHKCIVNATQTGNAILTAYADNGISCKIKIKSVPVSPQIRLESTDTVVVGENAVIKAVTSNDDTVTWHVNGVDDSKISYGGNTCRIKPRHRGIVTVSASVGKTTVSKTLTVLPSNKKGLNLSSLGISIGLLGILVLSCVLVYRRRYERKA